MLDWIHNARLLVNKTQFLKFKRLHLPDICHESLLTSFIYIIVVYIYNIYTYIYINIFICIHVQIQICINIYVRILFDTYIPKEVINCITDFTAYKFHCSSYYKQYVGSNITDFRYQFNNCNSAFRKVSKSGKPPKVNQEHFHQQSRTLSSAL